MSVLGKLAAAAVVLASVQTAQAMDYSYRLSQDHLVIFAEGEIQADEGLRFLHFTETLPREVFQRFNDADAKTVIAFDSGGGRLQAAFRLASVISGYHVTTRIMAWRQCTSACVVVWAAGVRRTMGVGSRIGVHAASIDETAATTTFARQVGLEMTRVMARWFRRNGAPDNVVTQTLKTPFNDLYWLSSEDLAAWNVRIDR